MTLAGVRQRSRRWLHGLPLLGLVACTGLPLSPPDVGRARPEGSPAWAPEAASARQAKPGWRWAHEAVAAAHPLAAEAGAAMLREGGSAVDAAVAVQMVLALVEPQSSGLGGGALLVLWDGQKVSAWDGRETAPASVDERLWLRPDGQPWPFADAVASGQAVGVPGAVRMLEAAHRAHGRLPWPRLFEPAIALADQGFPMGERLHALLLAAPAGLRLDAQARAYFFQPGADPSSAPPWPVGHRLRNPALAAVLRQLARQGSAALHEGPVAADIVRRVQGHPQRPGRLSLADLAGYRAVHREALCADWPGTAWRLCGAPPPSSGGLAMLQILGLLAAQPPSGPAQDAAGLPTAEWLHRYSEASRLAWADRAAYVADPAFVAAPGGDWQHLLAPAYLAQRAALIGPQRLPVVTPGLPVPLARAPGQAQEQPEAGTSHLGIADARGQVLSLTTTIESGFGAGLMSDGGTGLPGGFLLNNQLTDFAFVPQDDAGRPVANRVEPGKRPRSSMSPTLVFDRRSGECRMSLGSPGGAAIIHYTTRALVAVAAWGLSPQAAAEQPNFAYLGGPLLLERGGFPVATAQALAARGHEVQEAELTSGLHLLQRESAWSGAAWLGGADPRREGVVAGR